MKKLTKQDILNNESLSLDQKRKKYMKTEEWNHIRQLVLQRDNYHCMCCGRTEDDTISNKSVNLTVHHNTYNYLFNEEEHLDCLITLCQLCHLNIHRHPGNRRRFRLDFNN